MSCTLCGYAAKFHSYQQRRVLTVHGSVRLRRACYYCGRCKQSYLPYDDVLGLVAGMDAAKSCKDASRHDAPAWS